MHSNQQISWVNEVMHTQQNPISDSLDCHNLGAGEVHVPIQPHFKDPKKKVQLKVDGYHQATKTLLKTVYVSKSCYFHGCPLL